MTCKVARKPEKCRNLCEIPTDDFYYQKLRGNLCMVCAKTPSNGFIARLLRKFK